MENPKKRAKIETGADAVNALDKIILQPFMSPKQVGENDVTGTSEIPKTFFNNHTNVFLNTLGEEVYMSYYTDPRIKTPLSGDIDSLIRSHQLWEEIAKRLRDKCVQLKRDIALLRQTSSIAPSGAPAPSN